VRGFDRMAIDADVALFNQSFQRDARNGGKCFTQKRVKPPGRERFYDGESFHACGHFSVTDDK
jgi:hypothetical protein